MKRRVRKSRSTGKKSAEEKPRLVADAIIDALPEETTKVMESMIDGVTITDLQGRITYVNKAASLQLGYTKKETIGKTLRELFIVEQDLPKFLKQFKVLLSGKPIQAEEYLVKRKDGMQLVASFTLSVLRDAKGKPKTILVFHRDITERKRAEEERLKRERVFRMGEEITGSIVKRFGVGITSEELGLNDILSQFSELAVYPSPLNLFDLLAAGTFVVLRREGVDARKKEVREFLAPLIQRTLKELFVIAEEFRRDIPSEYKNLEKALGNCKCS